ncbi:MAG TPA: hypothetical protein DEB47_13165 [Citreicella sp.]|nr:hypothetical protein [Citreicella sp.]
MTFRMTHAAALIAFTAATPALAQDQAAAMGFALAEDGMTLVVMPDAADPATVETHELDTMLHAIAWRPVTGELLGLGAGTIYGIDPATGALTDLEASFMEDATIADGAKVAFDFNNAIDAVRAVSSAGDNLVYFPAGFGDGDERAGSVRRFTDAYYAEGDAHAGTEPMIFANAYTNAISGAKAGSTAQFALDAETDALVSLANNDGTLMTIGKVTVDGAEVDLSAWGGMDILSPEEGTDMAWAILQMEGADTAGLYEIDLATGAATMQADLGMGGFTGFAVAPAM